MLRAVILFAVVAATLGNPYNKMPESGLGEEWALYKKQYNKVYKGEEEEAFRRFVWEDNLKYVQSHNLEADRGVHTYWLGMNEYADMPSEEFVSVMNGYRMNDTEAGGELFESPSNIKGLAATVDWRTKGYVTPVKNQGHCGSCWSFSTTGSLEGQHFRQTKRLVSLSEQNLIDCSLPELNFGCLGGNVNSAFRYVISNHGIDTEASYPYRAMDGLCHFNKQTIGATEQSYKSIQQGSESGLQSAVATVGPVSVAIDASHKSFQLYKTGIYSDPSCSTTKLDHAVLVVGYGNGYWLVKNSWGTSWGMQGYGNLAKDKGNMCGIASSASYPIV